jgi:hypothetical protein
VDNGSKPSRLRPGLQALVELLADIAVENYLRERHQPGANEREPSVERTAQRKQAQQAGKAGR